MKKTAVFTLISITLVAFTFIAPAAQSSTDAALTTPARATLPASATAAPQAPIAADLDALLSSVYKPNEPGAAFLIWKDGKALVRKAYGLADLELGVRMEPDMVFRIGSMTKQFTAVSILMLMEQGKLALADPITKFLPDYPAQGKTITVEHLLTHTSGIKSYTDLEEWQPLRRKDMTLAEIIALFKDKPMDFAPGERWRYDNSGYILLGAIIEKVSGLTYEGFLQKNIFGPLGMTHTFYGNTTRVIPRRIPGYGPGPEGGFLNADYLSMTQPYAAGSLLSNVDDLAVWNEALLAGKVIKPETLARAWTPYKLADGTSTGYGYGWGVGEYEGRRMIMHGGGINGFATDGILFPEDRLFVTLLTNSTVGGRAPGSYNFRAAALALAKPFKDPTAAAVSEKDLALLAGVYANAWKEEFFVRVAGGKITVSGPEISREEIFPISPSLFFFKNSRSRVEFARNANGEPADVTFKPGFGPTLRFIRTAKALPTERQAIALDPKVFDRYVGEYELTPAFSIAVYREESKFMARATGQGAFEIFAESETRFFLKVVDAQVEFLKDAAGKVTGLVLDQNGRKMPGKKIK